MTGVMPNQWQQWLQYRLSNPDLFFKWWISTYQRSVQFVGSLLSVHDWVCSARKCNDGNLRGAQLPGKFNWCPTLFFNFIYQIYFSFVHVTSHHLIFAVSMIFHNASCTCWHWSTFHVKFTILIYSYQCAMFNDEGDFWYLVIPHFLSSSRLRNSLLTHFAFTSWFLNYLYCVCRDNVSRRIL